MTLYLELYDSETDDLLAKALDPKADRDTGIYAVANKGGQLHSSKTHDEALGGSTSQWT